MNNSVESKRSIILSKINTFQLFYQKPLNKIVIIL